MYIPVNLELIFVRKMKYKLLECLSVVLCIYCTNSASLTARRVLFWEFFLRYFIYRLFFQTRRTFQGPVQEHTKQRFIQKDLRLSGLKFIILSIGCTRDIPMQYFRTFVQSKIIYQHISRYVLCVMLSWKQTNDVIDM